DSEVLHTVRPIEEVPKTPAIGEHLGEAMKDFPYTSEQTEVSHDIVNKYREMLRAGIPLEPCNVVNGQHLMDGHHRAIAQMLELGKLVYVNHSELPGFAGGEKSVSWGDVHLQPTWGEGHINGAPLVDANGEPLVKAPPPVEAEAKVAEKAPPAEQSPPANEDKTGEIPGRKELLERQRRGEKVRIEQPQMRMRMPAPEPEPVAAPVAPLPELTPEQEAELNRRNGIAYDKAIAMRGTFEGDTLGRPNEPYPASPLMEALTNTNGDKQLVAAMKAM